MPLFDMTAAFAAAFGLIFGSYLNVVIYRLPRGLSTVRPASRCPRCVMPIRPVDNIPVLGYLWLFARCRDCGLPISPRYPLVEMATGVLFVCAYLRAENLLEQAAASLFSAYLLVLALIDVDRRLVPVPPTVVAAILGIFLQPWLGWASWSGRSALVSALFAALAGVLGGVVIAAAGRLLAIEGAFGWGDALVLGLIGAVLGPRGLLATFLLGSALVALFYAPRWLFSRRPRMDQPVPYVTFLAGGAFVALFAGPLAP